MKKCSSILSRITFLSPGGRKGEAATGCRSNLDIGKYRVSVEIESIDGVEVVFEFNREYDVRLRLYTVPDVQDYLGISIQKRFPPGAILELYEMETLVANGKVIAFELA